MNRRQTMLLSAVLLGPVLALGALPAHAADAEPPVTKAARILETLAPKDIVLDNAGRPTRPRQDPRINLTVDFTFDSAELRPQGKRQLDELALALGNGRLSTASFELAGHTDRVGDAQYNLALSLKRADAVREYLRAAHGMAPERLQTIGYGFDRLLLPNQPQAAANRRVEVRRLLNAAPVRAVSAPAAQPASQAATQGRLVPTPK